MITASSLWTGGLGRFGNQCFTLSGLIGIATKNNQPWGVKAWLNKDNALFGQPIDNMEDYFVNPLPKLEDGRRFTDIPYHWSYVNYNIPNGDWNICSHLQDTRYFKDYMPLIRHYFRMKDEPPQNDYVAIHYRAGDYIDDPNAYHPRCSFDYYNKAFKMFPEGTKFAVFTDGYKDWIKMFPDFDCFYPGLFSGCTYLTDFRFMKRCKHFITANSSFSLFAAILGEHPEKKIICPSRWFGASANGLEFNGYPENAIVI